MSPRMPNENKLVNYQRSVLFQTDSFEVVSIVWNKDSVTPSHNHGWSQCLVLIENGLFENTLDTGVKSETHLLETGQVLNTPVGSRHEMRCLSPGGKTLHVYTPKILERSDFGIFKVESLENLKRDLRLAEPTSVEHLRKIMNLIRDHSVSTHSPYFMNQLFSGILPQMLMAEDLISQTKTTMATYEASPAFSAVESEVVESLGQIIGWDKGCRDGVSVPGGSAANFMAVHCARQNKFPEIKKTGMLGARLSLFVSAEAHYSFKKACVALGFGTDSLVLVPVDQNGCMIPEKLDQLIGESIDQGSTPLMVSATAGTTVFGAFDPIEKLAVVCKKYDLWLHVDAAWGGPVLFSERSRVLVRGAELADSFTFDAHKLFGASLTCSFFLTQHPGLLLQANDVSGGDYLFHSEDGTMDRGKLSWQCGRKADAVSFWTIWKSLGTKGLGEFVDRLAKIRNEVVVWIKTQPRLELIVNPEYLNICVRIKPKNENIKNLEWSKVVREALKEKNLAMVNYSSNSQGPFLRLILAHPNLQTDHVKQILQWGLDIE
jgi:glutamate/tyrosine decarboxylase-like PLP-dependent enzyme/quercetin dioxygenase-like cupin family protein